MGELGATVRWNRREYSLLMIVLAESSCIYFWFASLCLIFYDMVVLNVYWFVQMIQKLSTRQPSLENRMTVLKEIAAENSIVLQLDEAASFSTQVCK